MAARPDDRPRRAGAHETGIDRPMTRPLSFTDTAVIADEAVDQDRRLKPSHMMRLFDAAAQHWWTTVTGMGRHEFCERAGVRVFMSQLGIAIADGPVLPGDQVTVRMDSIAGADAGGRRYGGDDLVTVTAADGRELARWTGRWWWLNWGDGGPQGFTAAPPAGLSVVMTDLPVPPAPPRPSVGAPSSSFTWSARDTDVNDHVYFLAYRERAENALAEFGAATARVRAIECFYRRPCVAGQAMHAVVTPVDVGLLVELRHAATGAVAASLTCAVGPPADEG